MIVSAVSFPISVGMRPIRTGGKRVRLRANALTQVAQRLMSTSQCIIRQAENLQFRQHSDLRGNWAFANMQQYCQ